MIQTALTTFSNWNVLYKTAALVYAAPIMIWGLGAIEGAVRTAFNGIAATYYFARNHPHKSSEFLDECVKDFHLSKSCAIISAVSLISFVGTCKGMAILLQCANYYEFRNAYQRALCTKARVDAMQLISKLDNFPVSMHSLNDITQQLLTLQEPKDLVTLLLDDRNKPASLIHHYWLYSISYINTEQTCRVIHFTGVRVHQLAVILFKFGIVRKFVRSAYDAVRNEVTEVYFEIQMNQQYHKILKNEVGSA